MKACGEGSYGRLGQGTSDDEPTPTPIAELQGIIDDRISMRSSIPKY